MSQSNEFDAVVVGAGFAGMYMLHRLRTAGFSVRAFEAGSGVGGTWYENRYPGCAVDTPNHFYQYSFEPNNNWPNYYSRQPSILAYLSGCADKNSLRPNIRFGREVESAEYDEDDGRDQGTGAGHFRELHQSRRASRWCEQVL